MQNLGCSSVHEFSLFPKDVEVKSSPESKEMALLFKTDGIFSFPVNLPFDTISILNRIGELKDSLIDGKSFTLHIPNFFDSWYDVGGEFILDGPQYVDWKDLQSSHSITVVGYNDTIKTKYGIGAFKLLNSWGQEWGNNGFGYIAYDWFFQDRWTFSVTFLKEKFDYQPKVILKMDLKNSISDEDRFKYFFVDTAYHFWGGNSLDFPSGYVSYIYYPNTLKITSINNSGVSANGWKDLLGQNSTAFVNNRIFVPRHNHDGNYDILADLTTYFDHDSFKSCEIVLSDPVQLPFGMKWGNILFSFTREANASIQSPIIKLLNSKSIIKGKCNSAR